MFGQNFQTQYAGTLSKEKAKSFLQRVYLLMGIGLFTTAGAAWYCGSYNPNIAYNLAQHAMMLILLQLGVVLGLSFLINKMSSSLAKFLFFAYSGLTGLTFSVLFLVYTQQSIATTFTTTAATFLVMSIWGYTTKRDLSGIGHFAMMGVIGIIIATIVNFFMKSTMMETMISYVGVLVFTILIAYDTQKLLHIGSQHDSQGEAAEKVSILGALTLYLDFINLFLFLLRLMGDRRK